jgi:flavin-dependent dehydrogenase
VPSSSGAPDILIIGAGPAGAIAGLIAARAGARVRILDRAAFPRDKLCGDTINPGALALLRRLGVGPEIEARGLRLDGMVVGMAVKGRGDVRGICINGRYPGGLHGRAILRRDLDWIMLRTAIGAGCEFDPGIVVRRAVVEDLRGVPTVAGVDISSPAGSSRMRAPVVVAADGRRSALAFGLGLMRHPARPRRWAIGGYFENAPSSPILSDPSCPSSPSRPVCSILGEMHIRRHAYVGVAPVPGGLTNVCLVRPVTARDDDFRDPAGLLRQTIGADAVLRDRLAGARLVAPPVVLGPLAVEATGRAPLDGLLLAGDAAGFIDPMTGDGLHFAIRGGALAAGAALRALAHGWTGVQLAIAAERAAAFHDKWRFNRVLRAIVGSPSSVSIGAIGARIAPAALRAIVARAGDCDRVAGAAGNDHVAA